MIPALMANNQQGGGNEHVIEIKFTNKSIIFHVYNICIVYNYCSVYYKLKLAQYL
jgi:hypothetical protein